MAQANKTKKIFDGRYEIIGIVGRGSQSVVYHARHALVPSTEVALKVLIDTEKKSSNKQSIHDKLRKEALCMVSARHRYVVRIDDFHSIDNLCYLSLEYAPHADLRKFLAKLGKPLSPAQAVRFLEQAAEALAFIHKTGMIHRDIKPDNILVMSEKEIRIGDFGVAVLPGEQSSIDELKRGVGTMDYMAPEVLNGTEYTAASDIYALGISFFEMITGKHPFTNGSMASQLSAREDSQIKRLSEVIPNVPGRLDDAIFEAMRSNSSDRIKNGSELLSLLRKGSDQPRAKSESPRAPFAEKPEHPPGSSSTKVPPQESPRAPSKQASPISQKPPGEPTSPKPSPINPNKPPRPQNTPPSTEKSKGDQGAVPASSTSAASILKRLEAIKKEAEMRRGAKPGTSDKSTSDTTKSSGLNFKDSPKDPVKPTAPQAQVSPTRPTPKPSMPTPPVAAKPSVGTSTIKPMPGVGRKEPFIPVAPKPKASLETEADQPDSPQVSSSPSEKEYKDIPTPPKADKKEKPTSLASQALESSIDSPPTSLEPSPTLERTKDEVHQTPSKAVLMSAEIAERVKTGIAKGLSSAESLGPHQRLRIAVVIGSAIVLLFIISFLFSGSSSKSPAEQVANIVDNSAQPTAIEAQTQILPTPTGDKSIFPILNPGIYHGELRGLYGQTSIPLSMLSIPDLKEIVILVGIPGWTPARVSLDQLHPGEPLRVASSGFVLIFSGENGPEGEIFGVFQNQISGIDGIWRINPEKGK